MLDEAEAMEEVEKDMTNAFSKINDEKSKNVKGNYSIQDYAIAFIYGMGNVQRERFKKMLQQGIKCGESVALNYGVDYNDLINEVKRILEVEEK